MNTYKQLSATSIQRQSDGAYIPTDPANGDYQLFLIEQAAGATVLPMDVPSPNIAILAQLAVLEANPAVCRTVREHMLATDQVLATVMSTLNPAVTMAQLLAGNVGHQRIVAVDNQAHALRAQLK